MLTRQYFVARTVKTQILHNPPQLNGAITLNLFLTYIKPKKMKRLITLIQTLNYISAPTKNPPLKGMCRQRTSKSWFDMRKSGIIKDLCQRFIFWDKPTRDSIVKRFC